ncbi:MAG TPA: PadR family transcriptional regulator [Gemmatimonadales bacterium]|nr:PadR family transcriptional regulator [Gemmatimonadales bacterium]
MLPLLPGLLDLCILRALRWEPTHGAGVAAWIRLVTDGALDPEEGTLYPALHRLERRGLVASEWGPSERNRRARHYQLTPAGRQHLRQELDRWAQYARVIDQVIRYGYAAGL